MQVVSQHAIAHIPVMVFEPHTDSGSVRAVDLALHPAVLFSHNYKFLAAFGRFDRQPNLFYGVISKSGSV